MKALAAEPGIAASSLQLRTIAAGGMRRFEAALLKPFYMSVQDGALSAIWASVAPDAQSKAQAVKRNGRSTFPWMCACPRVAAQNDGETCYPNRVNPRYLSRCPRCGTRREEGVRVDGSPE